MHSDEVFEKTSSVRMHRSISSLVDVHGSVVHSVPDSEWKKFCQQWPFNSASRRVPRTAKDTTTAAIFTAALTTPPVSTAVFSNAAVDGNSGDLAMIPKQDNRLGFTHLRSRSAVAYEYLILDLRFRLLTVIAISLLTYIAGITQDSEKD